MRIFAVVALDLTENILPLALRNGTRWTGPHRHLMNQPASFLIGPEFFNDRSIHIARDDPHISLLCKFPKPVAINRIQHNRHNVFRLSHR